MWNYTQQTKGEFELAVFVQNVPEKFSKWCERNAKKLDLAHKNGKLPYFVKDNERVVGILLGWNNERVHLSTHLTKEQKQYRKDIQNKAIQKFKGVIVKNNVDIQITAKSIKEFLNQPHKNYFIKK